MKIAHVLRKYNPDEWGGTETAVARLLTGLQRQAVESLVFCPHLARPAEGDPFAAAGLAVKRFRSFLPVWRISPQQRHELIAVGGNLLSFELIGQLLREKQLSIIHTHTLNRLGGTALTVARLRRIPLVVTVHGGVFDLPREVSTHLARPLRGGVEWGRAFGFLLGSKRVLERADAIITCNEREAELIRERHPRQRVITHPHCVNAAHYREPAGEAVETTWPQLRDGEYLLVLGRLDPVKNQAWVLEHAAATLAERPGLRLVFAGACTNEAYGAALRKNIAARGWEDRVLLTGGLPPESPLLRGLLQRARVLIVPSQSETFGLVILEAWAAGTPVLSSRTSGAAGLVRHRDNGWLFDLASPPDFHGALAEILDHPEAATAACAQGLEAVSSQYDSASVAARMKDLYAELIARKSSLCAT